MSRLKKLELLTRLSVPHPEAADINEAITELRSLRRGMSILRSANRLYRIEKASGADCASAKECFSSLVSAVTKRKWIDDHDLFISDGRVFAVVDTQTRVFFMDAITGSLYNLGECLTSSTGRTGFLRDKEKATAILMGFKGPRGDDDNA